MQNSPRPTCKEKGKKVSPLDSQTQQWIADNASADPAALALRHAGKPGMAFAIMQVECRRKAAKKIPELLANPAFVFPTALSAEQCTSWRIARYHASLMKGETLLDMTCGLAVDAFAFAGNGARVTAIDINPDVASAAVLNAQTLAAAHFTAVCADSVKWLEDHPGSFDTIFIDPARRSTTGSRTYALADCTPDLSVIMPLIASRTSRLIAKVSPMLDITALAKELGHPCAIHAVGTPTECKELVAVIDFDRPDAPDSVTAVTVFPDGTADTFSFTPARERAAIAALADEIIPGMLIHEPYPAVMKAGPYRMLCDSFGVKRLDPMTNLYVSPGPVAGFPGISFRVEKVLPFNNSAARELKKSYPRLNYTARNFPLTAPALAAKLKIKEGGSTRLFATTCAGRRVLVTANQVC